MMAYKKVTTTAQQQHFTKAINACQRSLLKYITYHVRSPDDVDGRVEDTLLEAYKAYADFRGDNCFKTWLYHIADHQIAKYYCHRGGTH